MFARVFPAHGDYLAEVFSGFTQQELDKAETVLKQLKLAFQAADSNIEETV